MQCPMQQLAKLEKTTAQSSTAQPKALTKRGRLVAVGISLQHPYGQASGLNTVFSLELAHSTGRINYLLLARINGWQAEQISTLRSPLRVDRVSKELPQAQVTLIVS